MKSLRQTAALILAATLASGCQGDKHEELKKYISTLNNRLEQMSAGELCAIRSIELRGDTVYSQVDMQSDFISSAPDSYETLRKLYLSQLVSAESGQHVGMEMLADEGVSLKVEIRNDATGETETAIYGADEIEAALTDGVKGATDPITYMATCVKEKLPSQISEGVMMTDIIQDGSSLIEVFSLATDIYAVVEKEDSETLRRKCMDPANLTKTDKTIYAKTGEYGKNLTLRLEEEGTENATEITLTSQELIETTMLDPERIPTSPSAETIIVRVANKTGVTIDSVVKSHAWITSNIKKLNSTELLDEYLTIENVDLPRPLAPAMTETSATVEGSTVIIEIEADEDIVSDAFFLLQSEKLKQRVMQPPLTESQWFFFTLVQNDNKSLTYRYRGKHSGATLDIDISQEELREATE